MHWCVFFQYCRLHICMFMYMCICKSNFFSNFSRKNIYTCNLICFEEQKKKKKKKKKRNILSLSFHHILKHVRTCFILLILLGICRKVETLPLVLTVWHLTFYFVVFIWHYKKYRHFRLWRFCGSAQFLQWFGGIISISVESLCFHKISKLRN